MLISNYIEQQYISKYEPLQIKFDRINTTLDTDFAACKDIKGFRAFIEETKELAVFVENCMTTTDENLFKRDIEGKIASVTLMADKNKLLSQMETLFNKVDETKEDIDNKAKKQNEKLQEEYNNRDSYIQGLLKLREELQLYATPYVELCDAYGYDYTEDTLDLTIVPLDKIRALYESVITQSQKSSKVITNIIGDVDESLARPLIAVLGFMFLLATPVAGLLLPVVYGMFMKLTVTDKARFEKAKTICALAYSSSFGDLEDLKGELKQVNDNINIEEDQRLNPLKEEIEELSKKLESLEDNCPEYTKYMEEFNGNFRKYYKMVRDAESKVALSRAELKEKIVELREKAEKAIQDIKDARKPFPSEINKSIILNTKFNLYFDQEQDEEYFYDVGLKPTIIYGDPSKGDSVYRVVRWIVLNYLTHVAYGTMKLNVYDDMLFAGPLKTLDDHDKITELFYFERSNKGEFINKMKQVASDNLGFSIEYDNFSKMNADREKLGKMAGTYQMFIMITGYHDLLKKDSIIRELNMYATRGVFPIIVVNPNDPDLKVSFTRNDANLITAETFCNKMYNVTEDMMQKTKDLLIEAKENASVAVLDWKVLMDKYVPDDKIWGWTAVKEVLFTPGIKEGDMNELTQIPLGNTPPVHGLVVGTTGAGKSGYLNQLIATLTRMYPPNELGLVLVDFKAVEFSYYLASDEFPYKLPHLRACLCTTDADFALSLFSSLQKEIEERYKMLTDYGVKNLQQYNEKVRQEGHPELVQQRVVIIIDEAKVIVDKAEGEGLKVFRDFVTYVGNVARAAGYHMIMCSQAVDSLASEEILNQYEFRVALRSSPAASKYMLGTDIAARIPFKLGWCYPTARKVEEHMLAINKIAFINDANGKDGSLAPLKQHIKDMAERAKKMGLPEVDVVTYDEKEKHSLSELREFITKFVLPEQKDNAAVTMFFGERMVYSTNRAPENRSYFAKPEQNIVCSIDSFKEITQMYRVFKTCIEMQGGTFYTNCQVEDLAYVMELEKEYENEEIDSYYATHKCNPTEFFREVMQGLMEERKAQKGVDFPPHFFILVGWDKARGFGIDFDIMIQKEWQAFLSLSGEVNIHTIFIQQKNAVKPGMLALCNTRIATLLTDDTISIDMFGNRSATKPIDLKDGYMFFKDGPGVSRVKIYQSPIERKIEENQFVLNKRV